MPVCCNASLARLFIPICNSGKLSPTRIVTLYHLAWCFSVGTCLLVIRFPCLNPHHSSVTDAPHFSSRVSVLKYEVISRKTSESSVAIACSSSFPASFRRNCVSLFGVESPVPLMEEGVGKRLTLLTRLTKWLGRLPDEALRISVKVFLSPSTYSSDDALWRLVCRLGTCNGWSALVFLGGAGVPSPASSLSVIP